MPESRKPDCAEDDIPHEIEAAEYIADLTTQLAGLARRSKLDLLGYLLDVASLEAQTTANRREDGRVKEGRRRVAEVVQG